MRSSSTLSSDILETSSGGTLPRPEEVFPVINMKSGHEQTMCAHSRESQLYGGLH